MVDGIVPVLHVNCLSNGAYPDLNGLNSNSASETVRTCLDPASKTTECNNFDRVADLQWVECFTDAHWTCVGFPMIPILPAFVGSSVHDTGFDVLSRRVEITRILVSEQNWNICQDLFFGNRKEVLKECKKALSEEKYQLDVPPNK